MPFLRVLADEENEFQIGQSREHWLAPQFGAFAAWRQVAAFGVKARETEAHGHDGDDLRIVENALTDAEPAAQADARRVGIGTTRGMDSNPRRLAGDANARGRRDLKDGSRLMREAGAISGRVAADAACADVFSQAASEGRSASMSFGLAEPRGLVNSGDLSHAAPARASRSRLTSASRLATSRNTEATASVRPARRMRTRPSFPAISPSTTRSSHFSAWPT